MVAFPKQPTTDFTYSLLNGAIDDAVTSIIVDDASTFSFPSYAVIDREDTNGVATPNLREVVKITNISTNTLTVERATSPVAHGDDAIIEPVLSSGFYDDFYDAYISQHTTAGAHEVSTVALLSGTTVQTLANKILSNPTLSTPKVTGAYITDTHISNASTLGASLTSVIISQSTIASSNFSTVYISGGTISIPVLAGAGGTGAGVLGFDATDKALLIGDGTTKQTFHISTWKSYTPTLESGGAIGNGVMEGYYQMIGTTCHVDIKYTLGTTSSVASVATGTEISLPVAHDFGDAVHIFPHASYLDAWTIFYYGSIWFVDTSKVRLMVASESGTDISSTRVQKTVPHTWAVNDTMWIDTYYPTDLP